MKQSEIQELQELPKQWHWRAVKAKKSLSELARQCGISYPTVCNAANGKQTIMLKNVLKVEEKLKEWGV